MYFKPNSLSKGKEPRYRLNTRFSNDSITMYYKNVFVTNLVVEKKDFKKRFFTRQPIRLYNGEKKPLQPFLSLFIEALYYESVLAPPNGDADENAQANIFSLIFNLYNVWNSHTICPHTSKQATQHRKDINLSSSSLPKVLIIWSTWESQGTKRPAAFVAMIAG